MIERIEHLSPELQLRAFANPEALVDRKVEVLAGRTQKNSGSGVPESSGIGRSKVGCVEPLLLAWIVDIATANSLGANAVNPDIGRVSGIIYRERSSRLVLSSDP
jgi:hypothetical protein